MEHRRDKTRKASKSSSRSKTASLSRTLPRNAATMHGLTHWYKSMFEKLGWMVIAKAKGYTDKVKAYKHSIDHLLRSMKHVSGEYEDHNRKHDLHVMMMYTEKLKECAAKIL